MSIKLVGNLHVRPEVRLRAGLQNMGREGAVLAWVDNTYLQSITISSTGVNALADKI